MGSAAGMDPSAGLIVNSAIGTARSTTVTTNSTTIGTIVASLNRVADTLTDTLIRGAWWARKHPANGDRVPIVTPNVRTLTCTALYRPMRQKRKALFGR